MAEIFHNPINRRSFFSDTQPVGWVEANMTAKGGKFTLHALAGNTDNDGSVQRLTWRT